MTIAWWVLVVVRGLLPAVFAISMGVLVAAVEHGDALGVPLAVIGLTFIAMQSLGPVHDALSANLGAVAASWMHDRLLHSCVGPPGLAHLEQPGLADELASARDFDLGLTGPNMTVSMPNIGGGFAMFAGGVAQALLLFGYRWWAPLLVGGAWGSTHHFLKSGAIWRERQSEEVVEQQRRAGYAYRLTVDSPAAKEVRLFGLADWVVDGFASLRHKILDRSWEARRLAYRDTRWAIIVVTAANGLFFWSLARDANAGHLGIGSLVVFAQAAIGASALAFGEFDWWLRTSAQPVPVVLDLTERMGPVGALPSGSVDATTVPVHEIRFDDVEFNYPTSSHRVLDGFDLTIPAGRSLAIVGQNGAGKTTLAKLLCRMYDPTAGAVLVDGIDLREFDLGSWRSRIAAVFQDFVRYELTLRENVTLAGASDDDVRAALDMARADELAGLDVTLSRAYVGGTDLSGGQWQRVALARALCAVQLGAGVVILDEPTAQLDVRGEVQIFERLLSATRGCTTILISHRFSTVRHADLICVVEAGRVIELGTHDELLAAGGRYRTMFDLQASRFGEADGISLESETLA
ncbi:MAG TPA: ABC transporter ATP-binding protein [Acidimicrobiales bacterium]|nr:ABC transporter ATP-binding protein [Acidimicrobiales bacterium]